jgi:hypothetical protein
MNKLLISLDKKKALKTQSGHIIIKDGKPMEVLSTNIEILIPEGCSNKDFTESDIDPIKDVIETLNIFKGTIGISKIEIKYNYVDSIIEE